MGKVDLKKMSEHRDSLGKDGGEFFSFEEGETLVYVHPPCRDDDEYEPTAGFMFVPIVVHYSVNPEGKGFAVSLNKETNPILEHPFLKPYLKKKKIRLRGRCPIAESLEADDLTEDEAKERRPQTKYLWGFTPFRHRQNDKRSTPWAPLSQEPTVALLGKQIHEGIMDVFEDHDDISDPDNAVLIKIKRQGKGRTTSYEVVVATKKDVDGIGGGTPSDPLELDKKAKAKLNRALQDQCDLFRIAGNMVKPANELEAMLSGVKVSVEDEDDDEDDLDDEPAPRRRKTASKKKPREEPEDDEDDDEDDLEEEDPPPRKKRPSRKRPSRKRSEPEDEEDEDEEDEDEDEEDPPPKKKRPSKKRPSKKRAEPEDDDEDDDLDDLEDALADIGDEDDEDEEEPPPPKKRRRRR